MINLQTGWQSVGMGISLHAGWAKVGARNVWVSFMANRETGSRSQQRCTWNVSATHYGPDAKPVRVICQRIDCHRYEAAGAALEELLASLQQVYSA